MAALDGFVRHANRYLVERAPWSIAKDPERRQDLSDVLYEALEALRLIAIFASPVMPGAAARLWGQLGIAAPLDSQRLPDSAVWGLLEPGTKTAKGDSLFPRLDD
jgi:methionyl-tRNA synthetase